MQYCRNRLAYVTKPIVSTVQRRNAWSRRWIAIRTTRTAVSQEAPSHGHTHNCRYMQINKMVG